MMQKILILLTHADSESITEKGQELLRDFSSSFQIRVSSAQLMTDYTKELVRGFQQEGGQIVICCASAQDALATLVSSFCTLPVLEVLLEAKTGSLPKPGPLPVATLGAGASGFFQAAMFALQILARQDPELEKNIQRHRHSLAAQQMALDQIHQVIFDG